MGLRLVGLAIGCRYGVVGGGDRDGGRAGRSRRRRSASPGSRRSGASRRRRPSRSATTGAGCARSSSPRRSPRRSTRRAATLGTALCRRWRRSSRPATSATRRRRRPGFAALSGAGAARAAHRADARLRGRPARPRVRGCCAATSTGTAALMVVAVPVLWVLMPWLIGPRLRPRLPRARDATRRGSCSSRRRCSSSGAGRSRSRSRSAGPDLRIVAQAIEIAVFVPLLLVFGVAAGARPARRGGDARLDGRLLRRSGSVVLAAAARRAGARPEALVELKVLVVSGIWPPGRRRAGLARARGRGVPARARARGRGRDHRRRRARARGVPRALGARARCRPASGMRRRCACSSRSRAARRRRLHDRDVRPLVARLACSARTPFVTKLTADPAYERARALGALARARSRSSRRSRRRSTLPLRLARDFDVRRAAHVVTPSAYLRELAVGWGVPPDRVTAAPEPGAAAARSCAPREELRAAVRLRRARRSSSRAG